MKKIKIIFGIIVLVFAFSCSNDFNEDINLDAISTPTDISALMKITQDNSGKVTFTPRGEGVTQYEIFFGDATALPSSVSPGLSVDHVYAEGTYQVKIVGTTLNGKRTEVIQQLTVSFLAPTDLVVNVAQVVGNNMAINVTATANLETYFQVYFGDVLNEVPTDFIEGTTITHTYAVTGSYIVKVVALSGGVLTTQYLQTVVISNPIVLPVTFESSTINYAFTNFGGANTTVVNNPANNSGNTSSKVAKLTKNSGSEVWAGSFFELGAPIDFSVLKKIKIKTWSPQAGITIKMKLENLANPNINSEINVVNTVANNWEELTFDFSAINTANTYQRVVIFFNFGVSGAGQNYYFDDIQLVSGVPTLSLPINFESSTLNYAFTDFAGNTASVENNANPGGINTSAKVGKIIKGNGALTYAGSILSMGSPINFSSMQKIKMKVWSPQAGIIVKLKLENQTNSALNVEMDATTTVANAWQELTYNFTGINNANNYQKVIVFFNFGAVGTGTTYYFDDIIQSN
jgi:hypothetical protein